MFTLYYSPASISLVPHIVLRELDLPHRLVPVPTGDEAQRRPEYLAIHPLGRVPALALPDGEVLSEVAAIVQHLAAGTELLPPRGGLALARCQEWLAFLGTTIHPAFRMFHRPDREGLPEDTHVAARAAAQLALTGFFDIAEGRIGQGDGPWLLGERYTVADPFLGVLTLWARHDGFDLARWPALTAWFARFVQRDAVRATLRAERLVDDKGRPTPPARF